MRLAAQRSATICNVIETAKASGLNLFQYLKVLFAECFNTDSLPISR